MIVDPGRLALFLAATVALLLTPGPAVLYIVARSLAEGRRAGLVSVLGVGAGNAVHAVAGVLGLAALLTAFPLAFALVRYLGAAYLVFLGVAKLRSREEAGAGGGSRSGQAGEPRAAFRQGFLVAVLNPKTALFFLAFLPQFVDPARGPAWTQMLFLGGLFVGLGVLSDGGYAILAGTVGGWLSSRPALAARGRVLSAAVYLALGVMAALAGA